VGDGIIVSMTVGSDDCNVCLNRERTYALTWNVVVLIVSSKRAFAVSLPRASGDVPTTPVSTAAATLPTTDLDGLPTV